jgi:hypothetical protein
VRLADGEVVPVDALFTGARARMASPLAEQLGCAFDDGPVGPVIRTDARKATSVPGVFAAGDATRANGNATMAVADGMMAGTAAHQSLALAAALASGPAAHRAGTLRPPTRAAERAADEGVAGDRVEVRAAAGRAAGASNDSGHPRRRRTSRGARAGGGGRARRRARRAGGYG